MWKGCFRERHPFKTGSEKNGSTGSYLTMFHGATEIEWIFQVRFSLHRLPASIFFLCRCHCELPLCRGNVSQCLKRLTSPLCAEKPGCYGYCYKCCVLNEVLNEIGNICSFHQLHFSLLPFRLCDSILAAGRDWFGWHAVICQRPKHSNQCIYIYIGLFLHMGYSYNLL